MSKIGEEGRDAGWGCAASSPLASHPGACAVINSAAHATPTPPGTGRGIAARITAVSSATVSVIIRARQAQATIGRCLQSVATQSLRGAELQTIVVDSGSRDATVTMARSAGAQLIELTPERFSFGRALNLGAEAAQGDVLVALSADAVLPDPAWLTRLLAHFEDERIACASGEHWGHDAQALEHPVRQDMELVARHPRWGYSNSAGGFRAELWRMRRFDENLPGCEDKEWARHWLAQGYVCILDPGLDVEHDHTHDPLADIYRRARREAEGFARFLGSEPYGLGALLRDWYGDLRFYDSPLRARLSHRRAARLLGSYAGRRRAVGR